MIGVTVYDLLPQLPAPTVLRERCRSFAVLDAIFLPHHGRHNRRHTYRAHWAADGTALASMDNGAGDMYNIAFAEAGTFLYGFAHECPATPWRVHPRAHWPGLFDGLPNSLAHFVSEPSFLYEDFLD